MAAMVYLCRASLNAACVCACEGDFTGGPTSCPVLVQFACQGGDSRVKIRRVFSIFLFSEIICTRLARSVSAKGEFAYKSYLSICERKG